MNECRWISSPRLDEKWKGGDFGLWHTHGVVNSIEDISYVCVIKNVKDVKNPLLAFHTRLLGDSFVSTCHDNYEECSIHIRGCKMVQAYIWNFIDHCLLQVCGLAKNEDVSVIEPSFNLPETVEITYRRRDVIQPTSHLSPVEITYDCCSSQRI